MWTKDRIIEQLNVIEIKKLNEKRTTSKIGEILGLDKAEYQALGKDNASKWFKYQKITEKIPGKDGYRSISTPISASVDVELE